MNLFELFVKIGVDDQASKNISNITGKLGNGLKVAAKIGTAAVGAAAAGITALTTAAVKNYAEYEQLVGGVDTLFKDASKKVQQYASEAYRTSGMSANDYMANATAFSASLISALGDDTEAAAEYANRAMVSMSDNANKMGTSIDSIVQTYQSLARGNFAMLDNLKLGYGGTKAELERLIADAASYTDIQKQMGITVDASSTSFDNIVNAISVVQGKLRIAGATAAEASTTIEGSVNSMKAAWQNLVTGIADENADFGSLIDQFVGSVETAASNLLPRIEEALNGAVKLIDGLVPKIVEKLPSLVQSIVPSVVGAAASLLTSVANALPPLLDVVLNTALPNLLTGVESVFSSIVAVLPSLVSTVAKALPSAIGLIVDTAISLLSEYLSNTDEFMDLFESIVPDLLTAIINVVAENLPMLVRILTEVQSLQFKMIPKLIDVFLAVLPEFYGQLIPALIESLPELLVGLGKLALEIIKSIPKLLVLALATTPFGIFFIALYGLFKEQVDALFAKGKTEIPKLFNKLINSLMSVQAKFKDFGKAIVSGLWNGLKESWKWLTEKVGDLFGGLVGGVKDLLGIHSPSRVFAGIGQNMALGVGEGWDDEFGGVKSMIDESLDFGNAYGYASGSSSLGGVGGGLSVVQNIYSEAKTAAELMREALYQQEKAVYLGV